MENKSNITVTTQTYFEDHFYWLAWCLFLGGFPVTVAKWYFGIPAICLGAVMLTTAYKLVVDPRNKQIEEFLYFVGMKRNLEIFRYEKLLSISVKTGTFSQQLNYLSLSTTIEAEMHSAYLVTDDKHFYIGESKNKSKILRKAHNISEKLNIPVVV